MNNSAYHVLHYTALNVNEPIYKWYLLTSFEKRLHTVTKVQKLRVHNGTGKTSEWI